MKKTEKDYLTEFRIGHNKTRKTLFINKFHNQGTQVSYMELITVKIIPR